MTKAYCGYSRASFSAATGLVSEIAGTEARQKLFCRRAEGIAEFDELVEAGDDAVFGAEVHDGLVVLEFQIAQGIDEEGGAAADFVAQQGDAGACVVEGLDDDIFEFIAEILFDGGFVLFLNFSVVGKDANGAEFLAAVTLVGGEKFLHRFAGVGAVI